MNFIEVEAKHVGNRETPEWYDPNGFRKNVLVYFDNYERIETDLNKITNLAKQASQAEDYVKTLKELTFSFPESKPRIEQMNKITGNISQKLVPDKQIEISGKDFPLKITAFYHDIVISEPYIILVFNTQAVGYPKMFPERAVDITLPNGETVPVQPISLIFSHNGNEYCVLYINHQENQVAQ